MSQREALLITAAILVAALIGMLILLWLNVLRPLNRLKRERDSLKVARKPRT